MNGKIAGFRQLSLGCETPPPPSALQRRRRFGRQFSEEVADLGARISLSAKLHDKKERERPLLPPPVRVAWNDDGEDDAKEAAKTRGGAKAKERFRDFKAIAKETLGKDPVLYSRQELAERLRLAWKEREQRKPNLSIFLAHDVREDVDGGEAADKESSLLVEETPREPKTILPIKPNSQSNGEEHFKSVFQKKLRRTSNASLAEIARDKENLPRTEPKATTVVVVPVVDSETSPAKPTTPPRSPPATTPRNPSLKEHPLNISHNPKPIDNVTIRPSTAAQKRELFQKRSSSAFQGSITQAHHRPPLLRASSVPAKQDTRASKPKFFASKRRAKTAKRREAKGADPKPNDDEDKAKKSEIVTMVSLTSPAGSDTEDLPQVVPPAAAKGKQEAQQAKVKEEKEEQRAFTLRKAVKSVTFQQSSIHAIRSFSASFPARRGSFATALMLGGSAAQKHPIIINKDVSQQKLQEKRSTTSSNVRDDDDYDERLAKRRLVRAKSVPLNDSFEENPLSGKVDAEEEREKSESRATSGSHHPESEANEDGTDKTEQEGNDPEGEFQTPKEKQCWDLYCKMSQKGVSVSFDTILRGMLTPTEYRMRRKSLAQPEDNC